MISIYKPGQGKYTRLTTLLAIVGVGMIGEFVLSQKLYAHNAYIRFGIPTLVLIGLAVFVAWMVNRPNSADFLIQTEGEMKKVSWSSRKEVIGSTKVVIIATFIMAGVLFGVDVLFLLLFQWMNVWPKTS